MILASFKTRPTLISFSRVMALVMRVCRIVVSPSLLWIRSRAAFSRSCTVSIFSSMCFMVRTVSLAEAAVLFLYCHSCKNCASPRPSIAPEPMPYYSASALERALVFCVRAPVSTASVKENCSSIAALTIFFVVSPAAGGSRQRSPDTLHSCPSK